jgi:hypothetical protein
LVKHRKIAQEPERGMPIGRPGKRDDESNAGPAPMAAQVRRAQIVRADLGERLQTLRLLQLELNRLPGQQLMDIDRLNAAIQHLETAVGELSQAYAQSK